LRGRFRSSTGNDSDAVFFTATATFRVALRLEVVLAEVHIKEGETLENALRRFKRKVLQEDIIKEVKRHAFYLKPGQKKRVKSALARKRNRKKRSRDAAAEQAR
jgi:small subunit ribosomal protein S21